MTSARKIDTNRANAKASTGPRTKHGKSRTAQNAFRHGLNLSILANLTRVAEVENMAREIAGQNATLGILELSRSVAEAQIDLQRVRQAQLNLLTQDPMALLPPELEVAATDILRKPEGSEKFALILSDCMKQLIAMDRYERRALSRRKFAIRALDAVRRQSAA